MRTAKGWLFGCFLALASAGCATTPQEPAAPRPDTAHPKVVKFSFGNGFTAVSYYYVADGVTAWLESHEPENPHNATTPQVIKRIVRTPSARQWDRFWCTLDRMQVERWKPNYLPTNDDPDGIVVTDGTDWTLTVGTTSQTFRSGGYGAFPRMGHPEKTIALFRLAGARQRWKTLSNRDNAIDQLEQAFNQLLQSLPSH